MQTTVGAKDFYNNCTELLDFVIFSRQSLVITKRGKAMAKLVPMPPETSLFGAMKNSVKYEVDIVSVESDWEVAR